MKHKLRHLRWRLQEALAMATLHAIYLLVRAAYYVTEAWYCVARWLETEPVDK